MSLFKELDFTVSALEDDSSVQDVINTSTTIGKNLGKQINVLNARTNLSITNFIKKMMVVSRVFIQNKIVDDPSLDDNLASIQNQYLAFILCALNLTESIDDGRTIKKVMSVVSTEKYNSFSDIADAVFGLEASGKNNNSGTGGARYRNKNSDYDGYPLDVHAYTDKELQEIKKKDPKFLDEIYEYTKQQKHWKKLNEKEHKREEEKRQKEQDKRKRIITDAEVDKATRDLSISSGRVIQVTMGGKKINIPVQLIPTVIPNEVAEAFVSLNFTPDMAKRWFQVTAGEISFFKDFLFQMDLIKQTEDAIRKDKTGILYEMKRRQKNAAMDASIDIAKNIASQNSVGRQNLANAIFIFDKQTFMNAVHKAGLNWKNQASRDRFFNLTFSFMIVLIDPIYAKSEYYWSGIDAVGEFSNRQLKAAAKKESYDLKDIMAAFSQGHGPRF